MLGKECSFADAREQALTLKPVFTKEETEKLLKETDDAYVLIGKFGTPSFGSPTNCANQLRRAQAGSGLTTLELLRIGENLRVIRSLRQWRNASDDRASSLDKYFNNLMPNKFLEEKINDAIIIRKFSAQRDFFHTIPFSLIIIVFTNKAQSKTHGSYDRFK